MKNFKLLSAVLSVLSAALLVFAACNAEELLPSLSFSAQSFELKVGAEMDLAKKLTVENSGGAPEWKTSDASVATVTADGKVKAVAPGEADVTASLSGVRAVCRINVRAYEANKMTLDCPETVKPGEEAVAKVAVEPADYDTDNLEWSVTASSDAIGLTSEKVSATEYKFTYTAYELGATIQVKVTDKVSGKNVSKTVTLTEEEVVEVTAEHISITAPSSLTEGDETWGTVTAVVTPQDYDAENLEWTFTPSSEEIGFKYEKVSDLEYRVAFAKYVEGGKVTIKVSDKNSDTYQYKDIMVAEKPAAGLTSLVVTPEAVSILVGSDPLSLTVTCKPADYDKALIVWTSSDEAVAKVSGGIVTAVAKGEAVIKAKDSISGLEAVCKVTVSEPETEIEVNTIALDKTSLEMKVGGPVVQLTAMCYTGANGTGEEVENYADLLWEAETTTDKHGLPLEIVTVTPQGIVTAKNPGTTTIKVTNKNKTTVTATCNVYVKEADVEVTSIEMYPSAKSLEIDETFTVTAKVMPENATDKTVTFSSDNEEVASVNAEGLVTGKAAGSATILATAANGVTGKCLVTVAQAPEEPQKKNFTITLKLDDEAARGLPSGASTTILWSCIDEDGEPYMPASMEWTSADPGVLEVDQEGKVTVVGRNIGESGKEVAVTLKADEREAEIVVKAVMAWPESITITDYPTEAMIVGETFNLGAKIYPEDASQDIAWTCVSGPDIAWLGDLFEGRFRTKNPGTYTLKAFAHYVYEYSVGSLTGKVSFDHIYKTVTVEVVPVPITSAELNRTSLEMEAGETTDLYVNFEPADNEYLDKTTTWASSDEAVATVSGGHVTAVAGGTAVISATLSDGKVLTCEVTVKNVVTEVNVGDYFYADGTYSSEYKEDAANPVVGIVFAKTNATNSDDVLAADHPECTRGLVLSLVESSEGVNWQNPYADVAGWASEQNAGYMDMGSETLYCGYSNTKAIRAYNEANPDTKILIADDCPSDVPAGTSGWYVPSYAELLLAKDNFEAISANIATAGGTLPELTWTFDVKSYYWSSTENYASKNWAAAVHFKHGGVNNHAKADKNYKVRYILAF